MNLVNRELQFPVPDGFDINAKVPTGTIAWAIVALALIAVVLIALFVITRYRQKGSWMGVFGGVALYFVFYYCAVKIVMFTVSIIGAKGLMPLYIILAALTAAAVPILGRMLSMKFFKANIKNVADSLSFGIGIMVTQGLASIINLFMAVVSSNTLNKVGIETLLTDGIETQEQFDGLVESIEAILSYDARTYIIMGLMTIAFMVFHMAASITVYAAFTNKVPKSWYAITISAYFGMQLFKYMAGYGMINNIVEVIANVIIVGIFSFLVIRMYREFYKDEEFTYQKQKKEEEEKKKKIPRFENLNKL